VGVYKGCNCMMRHTRHTEDNWNCTLLIAFHANIKSRLRLTAVLFSHSGPAILCAALVAGALAGATLAVDDKSRRMALALYISTRTLEFAYNYLNKRGYLPTVPHGDTLVMAIASAQIIYALVFEQDTLAVRTVASVWAHTAGKCNRMVTDFSVHPVYRMATEIVLFLPARARRVRQAWQARGAVA